MIIRRVFVCDITPTNKETAEATMDFSAAASRLVDDDELYGFTFRRTLGYLGIKQILQDKDKEQRRSRLIVSGSLDKIRDDVPRLKHNIGVIAGGAAQKVQSQDRFSSREWAEKTLTHLTDSIIPGIPDKSPIGRAVANILTPFVEAISTSDEEVRLIYGRVAPWQQDE
ncbi:hypothetical protein BH23PAT2_BH23PAT2_04210 [soil metagenome]